MTDAWMARSSQIYRALKAREKAAVAKGKAFAVFRWTLEQFREWLKGKADGRAWRCWYCGAFVGIEELSVDHKTPVAQGGLTHAENFVIACRPCNLRKGDMTAEDFEMLSKVVWQLSPLGRASVWRRLTSARQRWSGKV